MKKKLSGNQKSIIALCLAGFCFFAGIIYDFFSESGMGALYGLLIGLVIALINLAVIPGIRKLKRAKNISGIMVKAGLWQPHKMSKDTKVFLVVFSAVVILMALAVVFFETKHAGLGVLSLAVSFIALLGLSALVTKK